MKERPVLGLTEKVTLVHEGEEKMVVARVDTGATGSSIDESLARELSLICLAKTKTIRSASGTGKRAVVKAMIEIGSWRGESEFTVIDRSHMSYRVLIGQDIMRQGHFLVDPLKVGA